MWTIELISCDNILKFTSQYFEEKKTILSTHINRESKFKFYNIYF